MTSPEIPADAERHVCQVCGRVLSRLTRNGVVVDYLHPFDMVAVAGEDHEPVPVLAPFEPEPTPVPVESKCDFCFADGPRWVLPVQSFDYANLRGLGLPWDYGSSGSWAACDVCADLLNRGLWSDLTRRGIQAFRDRHGETGDSEIDQYVAAQVTTMYRQLRKNVAGSVRRLNG